MNDTRFAQLKMVVEGAVLPIRACKCRKRKMREELLSHIIAIFEHEAERLGDEQAALRRAVQRFGDPSELAGLLQESISASGYVGWLGDNVWFLITGCGMVNHNRLYNIILSLSGVCILSGLGLMLFLLGMAPDERPRMLVPQWSLPLLVVINGLYLIAMTSTLVTRVARPAIGKRLTKAMNMLLLIAPPFGTALGIYGLWKVDRDSELSGASS